MFSGAIKFPNQAQFNPRKYLKALVEKIIENGGEIYQNSKANVVERQGKLYRINTDKGAVVAEHVVVATHYPVINVPRILFYENVSRNIICGSNRNKRRAI